MRYFINYADPIKLICVDCGSEIKVINIPPQDNNTRLGVVKCLCVKVKPKQQDADKTAAVLYLDKYRK